MGPGGLGRKRPRPPACADPASRELLDEQECSNVSSSTEPDEELSFGRVFRIRESMNFQVRAELFNAFNRTYLNNPANSNAQATASYNSNGTLSSGFGYINPGSVYASPRTGQIIARFQF